MAKIYFKDEHGKNVSVEVSDEIAKNYRESLQEEWIRLDFHRLKFKR